MRYLLNKQFVRFCTAFLLIPFFLVGCGRNARPIKPSQAAIEQAKANKETPPEAPIANSQNAEKRFILDGLLD